jgi:hypothetical protein
MPERVITRRALLGSALFTPHLVHGAAAPVVVPVLRLLNKHIALSAADVRQFHATVWDEAAAAFRSCGVALRTVDRVGEIRRYPSGRPRFFGLEKTMLNVVLTDRIPLSWAQGRSLAGVTTVYEGHLVTVIALEDAYPNRLPFIAVNTVVHELLHVFRGDILVRRTGLFRGSDREAMVDWQATRLWLFEHAPEIRESAAILVQRLALQSPPR